MSYERPELFVLSGATTAVRTVDSGPQHTKGAVAREAGINDDSDSNHNATTSSTGGAYEADE